MVENISRIEKVLTRNDTGQTGSHQSGIAIPKKVLSFFPGLNPDLKNPCLELEFEDENGDLWGLEFIYYNNKLFGGTRNEFRLKGTSKFIRKFGLTSGDSIIFERISDHKYKILYSLSSPSSAEPVYPVNERNEDVSQDIEDFREPIDNLVIPESEYLSDLCLSGQSLKELSLELISHVNPFVAKTDLIENLFANNVYRLKDLETFDYLNVLSEENAVLLEGSIERILNFVSRFDGTSDLCDPFHILKIIYPCKSQVDQRDLLIFIEALSTRKTLQDLSTEWDIPCEHVRTIEQGGRNNLKLHLSSNSLLTLLLFFVDRYISNTILQSGSDIFTYPELAEHLDLGIESIFLLKSIFETQGAVLSETSLGLKPKYDVEFNDDTICIRSDLLQESSDESQGDAGSIFISETVILSAVRELGGSADIEELFQSVSSRHVTTWGIVSTIVRDLTETNFLSLDGDQYTINVNQIWRL